MWPYLLTNGRGKTLVLLLGDILLLTGVVLGLAGRLPALWANSWPPMRTESWLLLGLAGGGLVFGAHRVGDALRRPEILTLLVSGVLLVSVGLVYPLLPAASPAPVWTLLLLTGAVACAWHGAVEKIFFPPRRLVLVGRDPLLADLARLVSQEPASFQVLARVPDPACLEVDPSGSRPRRSPDLVVAGQDVTPEADPLVRLRLQGLPVWDAVAFYQHLTGRLPITTIDPAWLVDQMRQRRHAGQVYAVAKRLLDLLLALLLLPVALPVLAVCALAIKLDSQGPVFFVQERLGQGGVPFRLYKLRTMVVEAEAAGPQWCQDQDPRITRVGRVLRRLRLDELPQIFNILKNDMSFVGPRPIRAHFTDLLAREIPFYRLRLRAKPGLSGWAQVHSGHANTVAAHALMLQYDLFYLLHRSLLLDLLVLVKTVKVLLTGQGR